MAEKPIPVAFHAVLNIRRQSTSLEHERQGVDLPALYKLH